MFVGFPAAELRAHYGAMSKMNPAESKCHRRMGGLSGKRGIESSDDYMRPAQNALIYWGKEWRYAELYAGRASAI
jgi:hypothetical protein